MATRKIKDAKDLSTNELIYFKGHAKATYMSDGRTVEDAIVSGGGGISSLGFPINVYEITMGSITQTVRPYVHYQFLYEVFFGNASATINFNSSDNTGVYALEYVLDFQKFNGNVNIDATSYPIQWYNNEPPVFDGRGTLIYIYNNIGFWFNYELS